MPHIEILQIASAAPAPGWAYVLDRGHDPSKAAINPSGARKGRAQRAVASTTTDGSELTRREQVAIQRRIADLDRDNVKEIEVPVKWRNLQIGAAKVTTNVRRILMSEKTFAHHLNDEEAFLAQRGGAQTAVSAAGTSASAGAGSRRADSTVGASKRTASGHQKRASLSATPARSSAAISIPTPARGEEDVTMTDAAAASISMPPPPRPSSRKEDEDSKNPLLQASIPSLPTAMELETLLSKPPLSYNAARAAPPPPHAPPQRRFCELCGYWGRVKCLKCGSRVCGLECKEKHDLECRKRFA